MLKLKIACSFATLLLCFALSNQVSVMAHPGNTAADGGHYCWTRCEYWGEVYGQRHFHGGSSAIEEPETPEYEPDVPDYEPDPPNSSESSTSSSQTTPKSTSTNTPDKKGCYIATAAYGSPQAGDVLFLRDYRDKVLEKNQYGKIFVINYYRYSPYAASIIDKNDFLKFVVRETQVKPIVNLLKLTNGQI